MKDVAVLVTTFLRDECLYRCIKSIRKYYPRIPVYIGDNGYHTDEKREFCRQHECKYLELPFDLGVGGTRNAALERIPKKYDYIVIVEDDCVFDEGTKLENWHAVLQKDKSIGIVGGMLKNADGSEMHYEGRHRIEDNIKFTDKIINPRWQKAGKVKYFLCDLVLNVFMMRLDLWRGGIAVCKEPIRWDPQFKTALEHSDFFISVKYKLVKNRPARRRKAWKIAYTPSVWIWHKHEDPSKEYTRYRSRKVGFDLFGKKWGLKYSYSDYNTYNPIIYTGKDDRKTNTAMFDRHLAAAISILNKHKARWWLMSGTCLGAIRDGSYIGHDPDIDIGIAPGQLKLWNVFLSDFKQAGFLLYKKWTYNGHKIELSFIKYGIKIDLFFFGEQGNYYWWGAFGPDRFGRWKEHMECVARIVPAYLFQNLRHITFRRMEAYVPNPPERYLEAQYGPDWQKPNRIWQYWKDNRAIDHGFFKKDKFAFTADTWGVITPRHIDMIEGVKNLGTDYKIGIYSDKAIEKANLPIGPPYADRMRILSALGVADKAVKLDAPQAAVYFQKTGKIPDYYITLERKDDDETLGYLDVFGGKIIEAKDVRQVSQSGIFVKDEKGRRRKRKDTIAVGIKTFMREANFFRTLDAIETKFPYAYTLYIADDSRISDKKRLVYDQLKRDGHHVLYMPFNSGLSAGRNAIVKDVKEDYILILDDDIRLDDSETVRNMKLVLDSRDDIGIVSGIIKHEQSGARFGNDRYSRGLMLNIEGGVLYRDAAISLVQDVSGVKFRIADQVVNFFLAKREVFRDVRWDANIKIEFEHMDFFLRLKETEWKAAVCFDACGTHLKPDLRDLEYDRYRRKAPFDYFGRKHNITRIINRWH